MQWQTFAPECQLTDRLAEYGVKLGVDHDAAPGNSTSPPARILFYGDSVDRVMVRAAWHRALSCCA